MLTAQLKRWPDVRTAVHDAALQRHKEKPMALRFGLQIPRFEPLGDASQLRDELAEVARAAEEAGFTSLWVMDHLIQIPQVGREWEQMLDSWTTLGYLAAVTTTVRVGTLVTGAYGLRFPPLRERFALLEDALQLLPLLWGPGAPPFEGNAVSIPEAICYPRPLQDRIPLLVGGAGERRTLRLVATHADACNVFGDAATVRHKLDVLRAHCADVRRDPAQIRVTHLSTALVGEDTADARRRAAALTPAGASLDGVVQRTNAASIDDHIGRFHGLAEAGVQTAIVSLADLSGDAVRRFAEVISVFPAPTAPW